MAIASAAVWEVRSSATASNVNGGFFVTGASGSDFSQQDAAQYSTSTATSSGAGAVILWAAAAANMVGNGLRVVSGTNFTAGWYEIMSVSVGVSVTVDRNCTTGAGSNGVINVGGAMSLGSSDDAIFEAMSAGNKMWVKAGTYTLGGTVNIANTASVTNPIMIEGYNATRGDKPLTTSRPLFEIGAVNFTAGQNFEFYNLRFNGTGATVLQLAANDKLIDCKVTNTSTTASRIAIGASGQTFMKGCEAVSYRGTAISGAGALIMGCWIHDSNIGILNSTTATAMEVISCIIESCVTNAIQYSAAHTAKSLIQGNTIYGSENTTSIGISYTSGSINMRVMNNIFYGFTTAISHADVQASSFSDNNDYYNNDTNRTNFAAGSGDIAVDPQFNSVSQITGTAATTSGSVLTDGSKNFTTAGVVAGRDYIYLVSGTGITAGIYGISIVGTTTLTLDIAPGTDATADKVYQITIGRNFAVRNTAVLNAGYPGVFPGGYTTGYLDIGAVGAQNVASSGGGGGRNHLGPLRVG